MVLLSLMIKQDDIHSKARLDPNINVNHQVLQGMSLRQLWFETTLSQTIKISKDTRFGSNEFVTIMTIVIRSSAKSDEINRQRVTASMTILQLSCRHDLHYIHTKYNEVQKDCLILSVVLKLLIYTHISFDQTVTYFHFVFVFLRKVKFIDLSACTNICYTLRSILKIFVYNFQEQYNFLFWCTLVIQ